jgi:hypothetical protein
VIDLAVIASIPHLHDLSAAGSIDMALTHLALASPTYAAYHRRRAAAGVTVILDNSAYELETATGRGLAAPAVLDAAERTGARVVICQDVLYDGAATVASTRRFLAHAADRAAGGDNGRRYMAVPQGRTRAEWLRCHDQLAALPGIAMIGLSKLSVPCCFAAPVAEARLACVEELLERGAPKPLHLLGGDRSLAWELAEHRRRGHDQRGTSGVRSNDSSFAYWYAACGIPVDPAAGRACQNAPGKPDLRGRLDPNRLAAAAGHVRLLRTAAGLPAAEPAPTARGPGGRA